MYTAQNIKIKFGTLKIVEFLNKRFENIIVEKGYELNIGEELSSTKNLIHYLHLKILTR